MIKGFLRDLYSQLIDTNCIICSGEHTSSRLICPPCINNIQVVKEGAYCYRCSLPLNISYELVKGLKYTCEGCRINASGFRVLRYLGPYKGQLKEIINKYKFNKISRILDDIDHLIEESVSRLPFTNTLDYIVYIPLHRKRLQAREFDQSFYIARSVSRLLKIPILTKALIRVKNTPPQTLVDLSERKSNLKKAFMAKNGLEINGCSLLLVDDVYTTGTTISEGIKVLKKAGAENVDVFVLARRL